MWKNGPLVPISSLIASNTTNALANVALTYEYVVPIPKWPNSVQKIGVLSKLESTMSSVEKARSRTKRPPKVNECKSIRPILQDRHGKCRLSFFFYNSAKRILPGKNFNMLLVLRYAHFQIVDKAAKVDATQSS